MTWRKLWIFLRVFFFVVVRVVMDPDELVTWALHDRTKFRYH